MDWFESIKKMNWSESVKDVLQKTKSMNWSDSATDLLERAKSVNWSEGAKDFLESAKNLNWSASSKNLYQSAKNSNWYESARKLCAMSKDFVGKVIVAANENVEVRHMVIGGLALLLVVAVVRGCGSGGGSRGGSYGGKVMKAPGGKGRTMYRATFEGNPKGYFRKLRNK